MVQTDILTKSVPLTKEDNYHNLKRTIKPYSTMSPLLVQTSVMWCNKHNQKFFSEKKILLKIFTKTHFSV